MKQLLLTVLLISAAWSADTLTIGLGKSQCAGAIYCITFDSLLEDSRCPINAFCIQQGRAEVRLSLENPLIMGPVTNAVGPIRLADVFDLNTEDHTDTILRGRKISLLSVVPYPATNVKIDPSAYTVTLAVEDTGTATDNDYVVVTPGKPTVKDSLLFSLFLSDHCCCSQFLGKSLSVQDTAIYLSYSVNDNACMLCDCLAGGSSTNFQSGPLKAGTYGIYKAESIFCPQGQICPLGLIMPVRVGEVTVSKPLALEGRREEVARPLSVSPNPFRSAARISLGNEFRTQNSTLKIVDLRGRVVANLSEASRRGGDIEWRPSAIPAGLYLVKAEAGNRVMTKKILIE